MGESESPLDAALDKVQHAISGAALEAVLRGACQPMLEQARRFAPVRTGELQRRIQLTTHHKANSATAVVEVVDSGKGGQQHEAIFAEFGTSHQPARPFMRPAYEGSKRGIQNAIEQHLNSALRD
jgi:HK97 gp10 family phage protein